MTGDSRSILRTEGLTKKFGSLVAVTDVDLDVSSGEIHAIIGPNGAGKTTLFNMIAGRMPPTDGRIYFRGEDLTETAEYERAQRGISRAFQITQIFPDLSVEENLRLAIQAQDQNFNPFASPSEDHIERATRTLSDIDLAVPPTAQAETLSHGDRKKLEIGMSLAADPELLLLDEPTSGVAQGESRQLMEFLSEASQGRTVLLIEHNVDLVLELSDRITVLDQGAIISQGSPSEITADERVQEAYMGGY
jgi:branched-chain amino acid transport system ATP-binding protein